VGIANNGTLAVTGTASVTGNANVGNLGTSGLIIATGNVTGGNLTTGGQITSTGPGSATTGAGQLYLNGATNNRIDYNVNGTGAPTFTTRSAGTKIVFYPALTGSQVDYATGIDSATMWFSLPSSDPTFKFKFYGAETEVANIDGTGNLAAAGAITATGNVTGGNLITAGLATVTGNITGGNLTTTGIANIGTLVATGNANVGNLGTAGLIVATGNITGGNLTTVGLANVGTLIATGNANVGNLGTAGFIVATGNIDGANVNATSGMYVGGVSVLTVNATIDGGTY
jgi:hypothetical protein